MVVIHRALCPGIRDNRKCGADLSQLAVAACQGRAVNFVQVKCPFCHNVIGIELAWQVVPVAEKPHCVALQNGAAT